MTIDIVTNTFMQSIENPILTTFSKVVAHIFEPLVLLIIAILIAIYVYFKISKKKGICFVLTIFVTGVLIKVFKGLFQRARPLNMLMTESGLSLPSGHATTALVFFGLIAYLFANKKYKFTAITTTSLIILLTGFTRIYLRVHWLTDVLAGFILGGIILTASIIIYEKFSLLNKHRRHS